MTGTFDAAALELRMFDQTTTLYRKGSASINDMCRMLQLFHEAIPGTLDVFYVLNGGASFHEEFEQALRNNYSSCFYDPHQDTFPATFNRRAGVELVCFGNPEPGNIALLVDDSWKSGHTLRKAVHRLELQGYDRSRLWAFHFLGNGGDQQKKDKELGFVRGNPVLTTVDTLFSYLNDRKPSILNTRNWYPGPRTTSSPSS